MKRVVAALIAAILTFAPALAADWTFLSEKVVKSVVLVESKEGTCSGFVINSSAKGLDGKADVDLIMTAGHCDGKELYADQAATRLVAKDIKNDFLVLEIADSERPALRLSKKDPRIGEEVMSYGFGYAFERPMLRISHVSDNEANIPYEGIGGPFVITDATFVPGMSGGPVVNASGEVVAIVQMGTPMMGIGKGAEEIKKKVGKYFEKAQEPKK